METLAQLEKEESAQAGDGRQDGKYSRMLWARGQVNWIP